MTTPSMLRQRVSVYNYKSIYVTYSCIIYVICITVYKSNKTKPIMHAYE